MKQEHRGWNQRRGRPEGHGVRRWREMLGGGGW